MPYNPTGKPVGRPEKPVDWDRVERMMLAGCSGAEIAGRFNMHPETFYCRFQKRYNVGFTGMALYDRAAGDGLLREKQFNAAMSGNNQQLTRLCEIRLGQGKGCYDDSSATREIICDASDIKEMGSSVHAGTNGLPGVPDEHPVSHQGCQWQEDQVSDELGSTGFMEGEAQL